MSTERKLLYAFGFIIIAGMIAAASFSLGVYIGKQGWTITKPSMTGPGQPPVQPQGNPQDQPPGGNSDTPNRPDLIGKVITVTTNSVELNTPDGLRSVSLTDNTRILKQAEGELEPASVNDIQPGIRIAVFGQFGDDGRSMTGQTIIMLEPRD